MNPIKNLWARWRALRLPWRKSFLVGSDLAGTTYWEFKVTWNDGRLRRIAKFNPKTHYSDVKVPPQWHQWLRYVRSDPPSIHELQQDVIRQIQLKHLARLADERWASKPSYLDKPQTQQPEPALRTSDATLRGPGLNTQPTETEGTESTAEQARVRQTGQQQRQQQQQTEARTGMDKVKDKEDPWSKANAGNPGDSWQPESWTPTAARR